MSERTQTMWLILMTPKKRLLTRVSSLKTYGRLKIEELKIAYGKKKTGDWLFQILGHPKSRTFSFHDGDVIQKVEKSYVPLRTYSHSMYFITAICGCLGISGFFLKNISIPQPLEAEVIQMPVVKKEKPIVVKKTKVKTVEPVTAKMHELFLQAKRDFQYGRLEKSMKVFKKNIDSFSYRDKVEALSMMADVHYIQCQKWMKQHEERKAVISCEKAGKALPHEKAERFLSAQDEKARKLYLEAYTVQKFDPKTAKQKYALVLQSAQTKSTWRGKAQYQLRKLN